MCGTCRTCKNRAYQQKPEFKAWRKEYNREYRQRPESLQRKRERSAEYRKRPEYRDQQRRQNLWAKFRITVEEYDAMLESQGGVCAICGETDPTGKRLAVDHCHSTGVIRKLLCAACNSGLGHFRDSGPLMQKAIAYLEETSKTREHAKDCSTRR